MTVKILVLRFSSIGDIVLTTPVVRALKQQVPNVELHYATKPTFEPLLTDNPHVDRVHRLDTTLAALIKALRAERFDYVIDLHRNLRTALIKAALRVPSRSFDKLNRQKYLLVRAKIDRLPNRHIVDRYLDTVAPLGAYDDGGGLDYFIPYKDEVERDWLPETHRKEYVAYAIGGQHATKRLPLPRMIELCDKINKPIVLLGGPEDRAVGDEIVRFFARNAGSEPYEDGLRQLGKKALVHNACGQYNLNQSASLVRGARAVFTHDTGLMHVAAAFQKPIYSIWGSTTPKFGMYPYRTRFVVFENNRLGCRPCSKIGHDKCPKGHFKCMNELVFDFYLP
ncbi:MAG: glycosyltransferase family 9 protein [Catalinimonas sp.]